jgi:hypothetical protein
MGLHVLPSLEHVSPSNLFVHHEVLALTYLLLECFVDELLIALYSTDIGQGPTYLKYTLEYLIVCLLADQSGNQQILLECFVDELLIALYSTGWQHVHFVGELGAASLNFYLEQYLNFRLIGIFYTLNSRIQNSLKLPPILFQLIRTAKLNLLSLTFARSANFAIEEQPSKMPLLWQISPLTLMLWQILLRGDMGA